MPTQRPTRRRQRRQSGFTPAELQYLTGKSQTGVNPFALVGLEHPTRPADFERIDELLARADGIVSPERLAEIRAAVEAQRAKRERYRSDPHAAWAEDSKRYGI